MIAFALGNPMTEGLQNSFSFPQVNSSCACKEVVVNAVDASR